MEKYDISQLTEFPRFESEPNQSGVTTFFNKLWKLPLFSPNETAEETEKASVERKQSDSQADSSNKQSFDDTKTESGSYAVEFEGRSLPNVLQRISSLIALGSGGGTRYADTELARYWMPDDISRECYECAARFGALRRRHHCRVCGQIFCSRCCSQRVPGQIFGCAGGLRVCTYCCNVVLSYLRENDAAGDISPDLRTLQENLQVKFPDNKAADKGGDNFMFARQQEERPEPRADTTESLHDLIRQLAFSLPMQQHRFRLVRYISVWRGCDVMQWVMDNTSNKTRAQAAAVCQALLSAGHLESVTEPPQFADYALYRPAQHVTQRDTQPADNNNDNGEECGRLVESVSSYCLDLNLGDSSARLTKATKTTESKSSPSSEEDHPILDQSEGGEAATLCRSVEQSGAEHLALLLRQCLARASLAPSWLHVLYPLCQQAADIILPDMYGNDIDVRNYVQVKKVPGGSAQDSCLLQGVVLTKNVAHRGMPQQIPNPTVLLLDCSIAYQRVEGKLTSLEPLLMQEQEYLVRCAARITALRPRVVLVRGGAARGVQDALRAAGVALAAGVRDRALRRAARCARADLVASVDARIATPRLGTAKEFYVKNFSGKTLMVLEGCAEPHLGCCILLRGGSLAELVRVKKVVKFMLLAFYNWKFEKAFLADIEAVLPEPGMSFGDEEAECASETDTKREYERQEKESLFNEPKEEDKPMDVNKCDVDDKDMANVIDDMEDSNIELFTSNKNDTKSITSEILHDKEVKHIKEDQDSNEEVTKTTGRKIDGDKNLSCGVPIRDFSDPLRATLSMDDEVFLPKEEAELKADSHSERWCTDDAVLSMSPNIVIPAPRLPLLVPTPHTPQTPHTPRPKRRPPPRPQHTHVILKEPHPFIKMAISSPAEDPRLRAALANYRATGARLANTTHKPECPQYKPSILKPPEIEVEGEDEAKGVSGVTDPLAPEQHQRLSLLLYSCSDKSANVPDFCVNPWIVTMEMYGRHDISLGAFLERHCFDGDHRCPSANCQVPMNRHLRRFVHGEACITITCNTIGHSNVDKTKEDHSREVRVWTRCEKCGATSRGRRLSRAALSLSLAQYMRLRLSATRYVRRALCPHPLHAHAHAFVARLTTACFRYNKISMYDIQLPPDVISINYDTKRMRDNLIAHLNELVLKGHETFSVAAGEGDEKEREYAAFRHHMDLIHLALTSASLHEHVTLASVVRNLWNVSDNIVTGERMLRDAQDKWSSPLTKNKLQTELNQEDREVDESSVETAANDSSEIISKDIDKEYNIGTEEDEEKGDKKTVKQILSQLLSSNQQANQNGIILSSGVVPVVVRAGDVGSVIAATLASLTYQKTLRAQRYSTQNEQEDGESNVSGKEKNDGDKTKSSAAKSNEHIEVLLKDGLACRVYFALQFHGLRHAVLAAPGAPAPGAPASGAPAPPHTCSCHTKEKDGKTVCEVEEGFIRSLAQCVPWAARGGKSGSTFCKTEDDRYVLKEMTKPEWQQFLEFAPHYFSYVNSCRLNKQPSLLARILGVFSVGGSGSGVLVMENVWYGASGLRFDLKGTARPRLPPTGTTPTATPHTSHNAQTVLVDLNLLHLRWERQLYVPAQLCGALWAALGRDTAFLASSGVMDYSLLLGLQDHTLVLGVIDYIRTFTWDKKLEHLVKKNLGSGQPTVVSPEEYRRRFCAACRKYFLQCPEHWDHLYDNTDTA